MSVTLSSQPGPPQHMGGLGVAPNWPEWRSFTFIDQKGFLPVNKVFEAHFPEGISSCQWGANISSIRRDSFGSMMYLHLIDWKGFLPIDEVRRTHGPEGISSDQWGTKTTLMLRWQLLYCSICMLITRYASTKHPNTTSMPASLSSSPYQITTLLFSLSFHIMSLDIIADIQSLSPSTIDWKGFLPVN
jgi:hypothetical protein